MPIMFLLRQSSFGDNFPSQPLLPFDKIDHSLLRLVMRLRHLAEQSCETPTMESLICTKAKMLLLNHSTYERRSVLIDSLLFQLKYPQTSTLCLPRSVKLLDSYRIGLGSSQVCSLLSSISTPVPPKHKRCHEKPACTICHLFVPTSLRCC